MLRLELRGKFVFFLENRFVSFQPPYHGGSLAVLFSCQAELADAIEESQKKLEAFADPQGAEDRESHRLNFVCPFEKNTRSYFSKLGNFSETFHESKGVGKFIYQLSICKSQPPILRGALALTIATWGALRPFFRRKKLAIVTYFSGHFKTEVFFQFGNELILSRIFVK